MSVDVFHAPLILLVLTSLSPPTLLILVSLGASEDEERIGQPDNGKDGKELERYLQYDKHLTRGQSEHDGQYEYNDNKLVHERSG